MQSHTIVQNDVLSIGSIGQVALRNVGNPVARRGLVSEAAPRASLTKPHISPLTVPPSIKIENSSVRTGVKTERFTWDVTNETQSGGYYLADNPADVLPVYVPQFGGSAEIWAGASLVIVKRPPLHKIRVGADRLGGGLRAAISGFSEASRLRMKKLLGKIRNDRIPIFVTLTYPADWPHDSATWKRHLDTFFKRLRRQFDESSALWKLEPQQRGAPHYHLLIWGAAFTGLLSWVNLAWFEVVNSGDQKHLKHGAKIEQIRSWRGVQSYASKYLGKLQSDEDKEAAWRYPGRWWGVYGRERIPWGECIKADLSRGQSIRLIRIMRKYQERHSPKFKKFVRSGKIRGHFDSLSILSVDAVTWFRRLDALIC